MQATMDAPAPANNDPFSTLVDLAGLAQHDLVYVANPYTHYPLGMDQAYLDVCEMAWWLNVAGVNHYSPIIYTHPLAAVWGVDRGDVRFWIDFDKAMMKSCDALAVIKMDGWSESEGVALEIAEFHNDGKPIYTIDPATLEVQHESN